MRLATALLSIGAIAATSVPASAQIGMPSDKDQVNLGKRASAEVRKKERVLSSRDDRVLLVRKVGDRLLRTFEPKTDLPWEFTFDVVENKQVNAFALPGGPVFIYSGLLDKLETEDQLAGVMGHEITHVLKEHWARQYAESQKRGLILGVLLGVTRAGKVWQTAAGVLDVAEGTKYSRGAETQSDDRGFEMMAQAGYNPMGMADVFRMFEKQKKGGLNISWLSSHPSDASRIKRIEERVTASKTDYPAQRPLRYDAQDSGVQYRWWRIG